MKSADKPKNELKRLEALRAYHILDTGQEQAYDDIVEMASYICDTPVAMVSLVDNARQWFKSKIGTQQQETSRDIAFCAHAILHEDIFIVPDADANPDFADNPLVTGEPHIRFYAGVPLNDQEGHSLGSLCVIDRKPRVLNPGQLKALKTLGRHVMTLMETRRVSAALAEAMERAKVLSGMLPVCSYCKRIRDDEGHWSRVEEYVREHTEAEFNYGACAECSEKILNELRKKPAS